MGEFHVEAIDPSIKAMHLYNMVGYYIIVYVLASPISRSWKLHGLGGSRMGWEVGFGLLKPLEVGGKSVENYFFPGIMANASNEPHFSSQ